ncbi:MAG: CRTAC1 family protein [Flavobacteriaceae bacterium]
MEKVISGSNKNPYRFYSLLIFLLFFLSCKETVESRAEKSGPFPIFKTVTQGRIATDGGVSRGVAWGDYDQDGDPDLYVANTNGQWNAFYRNNGNGTFKKLTFDGGNIRVLSETVKHGGRSEGVNWVDYDNDGDLDLYVVSRGGEANLLFRNFDNKGFTKIEDSPLTAEGISASMACWADFEGDGDLDVLIVATGSGSSKVFKNLGEGNFEEVAGHIMSQDSGRGRACACGDATGDGLPEFYIANAMAPNYYYRNLGNFQFELVASGHIAEDVGYSYGASWADYDSDGDLDLFLANFDKENYLYNNDGNGNLTPIKDGVIALEQGGASKGHSWGDYDNDGDLDLFVANGTYRPEMQNFLYLNNGDAVYEKILSEEITIHADTSAGAAHADFDRDGDLDLFVANWGSGDQVNRFYENKTAGKNWIMLRLKGSTSNRFGIGAKVTLQASNRGGSRTMYRWMYPITGYASQDDYELHFGLGNYDTIDSLVIDWPSHHKDIHTKVPINTHFLASENDSLTIAK